MKNTEIPSVVRMRVYKRDKIDDWVCCIYCGSPNGVEVHHFVERSRGGMGIEENLVCLCPACHNKVHTQNNKKIKKFMRDYLVAHYEDWDESKVITKKGINK